LDAKLARSGPNKHFEVQIIIPHPRLETLKQNLEVLYMKEQISLHKARWWEKLIAALIGQQLTSNMVKLAILQTSA
jgi:hypothetical protein